MIKYFVSEFEKKSVYIIKSGLENNHGPKLPSYDVM